MPRTGIPSVARRRIAQHTNHLPAASSSSSQQLSPLEDAPTPPQDVIRYTQSRIRKAERDERMDITTAMREVKT